MPSFKPASMLDFVEAYAEQNDLVASEQELSDRFDEEIAPLVVEEYGPDDQIAMHEAFNDWSDSLHADGLLHDEQVQHYCYVGEYADD